MAHDTQGRSAVDQSQDKEEVFQALTRTSIIYFDVWYCHTSDCKYACMKGCTDGQGRDVNRDYRIEGRPNQ